MATDDHEPTKSESLTNRLKRQRQRQMNRDLKALHSNPDITVDDHEDASRVAKKLLEPVSPVRPFRSRPVQS